MTDATIRELFVEHSVLRLHNQLRKQDLLRRCEPCGVAQCLMPPRTSGSWRQGAIETITHDVAGIPDALSGWDYHTLTRLAKQGSFESDIHDFKGDLPNADTLTKLACAFANSRGGFIIFGVKENGADWVIAGLDRNSNFAHYFSQKISAEPSIHIPLPHEVELPDSDKVVYVVHVPRSDLAPHFPQARERRVFWKRTNQGCEQMSLEEIRSMFLNFEERRSRLKQLVVELDHNASMLHSARLVSDEPNLDVFETSTMDGLLVDSFTILQEFPQVLQELQGLRRQFHQLSTRRHLFIAEMGKPSPILIPHASPVDSYNQFIAGKSRQLLESIARIEGLIDHHFGIKGAAMNWQR